MNVMTTRRKTCLGDAILAISAMSALVGCASTSRAHSAGPQEPGGSPSGPDDDATRGIHVEQDRLGFDHKLEVRPSKTAMAHELHDGATVMTGDRIRATVVTSEDAYAYLAFCAGHELAIYPPKRGVRTTAGSSTPVPQGTGEIVVDGEPGTEVVYLIVSRTELSLADPRLSAQLAAAGQDGKIVDCGASLDAEFARPAQQGGSAKAAAPSPKTQLIRGRLVAKKHRPVPHTRGDHRPADPTASGSGSAPPVGTESSALPQDEPDFIRSPGTIVWYGADGAADPGDVVAADADGIAVVRYRFTHIARSSSP